VLEAKRLEEEEGIHDDLSIKPHVKERMLQKYNQSDKELDLYDKEKRAKQSPWLKAVYEEMGYVFDEPGPLAASIPESIPPDTSDNAGHDGINGLEPKEAPKVSPPPPEPAPDKPAKNWWED
jgi:hypothetical protein